MPDDKLTAEVARIKNDHRQHVSINFPAPGICYSRCSENWPCTPYRAADALDAVLKPHQPGRFVVFGTVCKCHENHPHFSITAAEAAHVQNCQDCTATVYRSCAGCGPQVPVEQCPTRSAIATALSGEAET